MTKLEEVYFVNLKDLEKPNTWMLADYIPSDDTEDAVTPVPASALAVVERQTSRDKRREAESRRKWSLLYKITVQRERAV